MGRATTKLTSVILELSLGPLGVIAPDANEDLATLSGVLSVPCPVPTNQLKDAIYPMSPSPPDTPVPPFFSVYPALPSVSPPASPSEVSTDAHSCPTSSIPFLGLLSPELKISVRTPLIVPLSAPLLPPLSSVFPEFEIQKLIVKWPSSTSDIISLPMHSSLFAVGLPVCQWELSYRHHRPTFGSSCVV